MGKNEGIDDSAKQNHVDLETKEEHAINPDKKEINKGNYNITNSSDHEKEKEKNIMQKTERETNKGVKKKREKKRKGSIEKEENLMNENEEKKREGNVQKEEDAANELEHKKKNE